MKKTVMVVSPSSGVGFIGILTLIFITLKLIGILAWSWWWVISPIWISLAIVTCVAGLFLLVMGLIALLGLVLRKYAKKRRLRSRTRRREK